jgi:transcriptional regulator with XRE-family HTH domain
MQMSDLIRQARRTKDLTQEELGELVGVHHKTVGKWERGVAHPRGKLPKLEQVLGVKLVNRPQDVTRVRVADPATLSNAELVSALLGYTAEMARRLPPEPFEGVIDPETILREGWSATRESDLDGPTSGATNA